MMHFKVRLLVLLLLCSPDVYVLCYHYKREEDVTEYCMQDTFNATCPSNQVVLMTSARYGRMRSGKCIEGRDKLNCSKDVLAHLDSLCSGKQTCVFTFPGKGTGIYETSPCGKDYTSYMEASHMCVKVETTTKDHCLTRGKIRVSGRHGYISSEITKQDNIGSRRCPWLIETNPGQQINLTIYNFIRNHDSSASSQHSPYSLNGVYYTGRGRAVGVDVLDGVYPSVDCDNRLDVGVIYEAGKQKTVTMCSGTNTRVVQSYVSTTNTVSFKFVDKSMLTSLGRFLVEFKVTGCPDIEVPSDTWAERDGTTLRVKCNKSRNAWFLTCSGDTWVGRIGNCTLGNGVEILNLDYNVNVENTEPFPYGILFVVAIGVAIGIVLGGGMLVALVMYNKSKERDQGPFTEAPPGSNTGLFVNPETRAWVQAHHQNYQKDPEHEQQYIDEGIVRDIQSIKDPVLYGDTTVAENRNNAANAQNQGVISSGGNFHQPPPHFSHPNVEVRGVCVNARHEHIGQGQNRNMQDVGHLYEHPQQS